MTMEKLIASCGLNCAACDARIATITNDNELRNKTAELWRVQYGVPGITAEMINCTGCREEGAKISHCAECEIRNCVVSKGFKTCAECGQLETCALLKPLFQHVPEALENLRCIIN
jgi:hypothetical protein